MKPPRYLLREYAVRMLLRRCPRGKFLELGYGRGQMLTCLARLGFAGHGYDFSTEAKKEAQLVLTAAGAQNIVLLDKFPASEKYAYIFFFDVIGYFSDVNAELSTLRERLKEGGKMIFSFVRKDAGYSNSLTGDMRCFDREEMVGLVEAAGLRVSAIWNYGFPLANFLVPFSNWYHRIRSKKSGMENETIPVKQTAFVQKTMFMKFVVWVINPFTIFPFAAFQLLFRRTSLGNGYLLVAEKLSKNG